MKIINKNNRIFYGIIYASIFFITIIIQNSFPFLVLISILMYGSISEFITINKNIKTLRYQGIILSYIIISFLILLQLKFQNQSEIKLLILLLHVWSSDVGGYIIGTSIGKHFITKISPKKTC